MANKLPQISGEGLDISRYGGRVARESGSCVQPAH